MDSKLYSQDYLQKVKKDFPDLSDFNERLDKSCSSIFAGTSIGAIVMVAIFLNICIMLGLGTLLNWLIPSIPIISVFVLSLAILFAVTIMSAVFSIKKYREKPWAKKYHYPIAKRMGQFMYILGYEPVTYVTMTFFTNATKKKLLSANNIILLITYITLFPIIFRSDMIYFQDAYYFRSQTYDTHIYSSAYENHNKKTIIKPIIQSDIINESAIRLFIPKLERENKYFIETCGEYEKDETESKDERRISKNHFQIDCAKKYYQVFLNDILLSDLKFRKFTHPNNQEPGFVTYIPTTTCKPFENILRIESPLKNEEGETWKKSIPFIFEKY
jgi:hypothetical protein